jgi:hypothetical protein
MAKLSRDRAAQTLHPRENIVTVGNLGALNAEVIVDTHGAAMVALDLRGTFSMTVEVSGTVDGTNWILIPVRPMTGGIYVAGIAGSVAGAWVAACAGFDKVRARVTAFTSGLAIATLLADTAPLDQGLQGWVTPGLGTALSAVSAAQTLTLAAPGAGLRHYITYVRIARFATALLTAGATPVAITTTNLPGSLAFSFPADAAAQGTLFPYQEDFSFPLAASAQNTATSIVCPATTGVIWRVTAGFYVAP